VLWARLEPLLWYLPSDEQRGMVKQGLQAAVRAHSGQVIRARPAAAQQLSKGLGGAARPRAS
jgi:hypothetical protein